MTDPEEERARAERSLADDLQKLLGPGLGIGADLQSPLVRHELYVMWTNVRLAKVVPAGIPRGKENDKIEALHAKLKATRAAMEEASEDAWHQRYSGHWDDDRPTDSTIAVDFDEVYSLNGARKVRKIKAEVHPASLFSSAIRNIDIMIAMTAPQKEKPPDGRAPDIQIDRALRAIIEFFSRWSRDKRNGLPIVPKHGAESTFSRFANAILDHESGQSGRERRKAIARAVRSWADRR